MSKSGDAESLHHCPDIEPQEEEILDPICSEGVEPIDLLGGGRLVKTVIKPGIGDHPPVGSQVRVHYRGTLLSGEEFDSSYSRNNPFAFTLGVGQVIKGWDEGIASMTVGEVADLTVHPELAYGVRGAQPSIPPNSVLKFRIELLTFARQQRDRNMMSAEERLQEATTSKEDGNKFFKEGHISKAIAAYEVTKDMLVGTDEWIAPHKVPADSLRLSAHLNLANCYLKSKAWLECILECTAALKLDGESVKALYRRGVARTELGEFEPATADLVAAGQRDPKSIEIRKALARCKQQSELYKKAVAQTYARMFV